MFSPRKSRKTQFRLRTSTLIDQHLLICPPKVLSLGLKAVKGLMHNTMIKYSNARLAAAYYEGDANTSWVAINIANSRKLSEQDLVDYYLDYVGRA